MDTVISVTKLGFYWLVNWNNLSHKCEIPALMSVMKGT